MAFKENQSEDSFIDEEELFEKKVESDGLELFEKENPKKDTYSVEEEKISEVVAANIEKIKEEKEKNIQSTNDSMYKIRTSNRIRQDYDTTSDGNTGYGFKEKTFTQFDDEPVAFEKDLEDFSKDKSPIEVGEDIIEDNGGFIVEEDKDSVFTSNKDSSFYKENEISHVVGNRDYSNQEGKDSSIVYETIEKQESFIPERKADIFVTKPKPVTKGKIEFIDKVKEVFDETKPEGNEAAVSNIDERFEKSLENSANRNLKKVSEIRKIEKAEEKKSKANKTDHEGVFQKSSLEFSTYEDKFIDEYSIFKKNNTNYKGESYFKRTNDKANEKINTRIRQNDEVFQKDNQNNRKSFSKEEKYFSDENFDGFSSAGKKSSENFSKDDKFTKNKKKNEKKEKKKNQKRAAAKTAMARVLKAKKSMQNNLGDMSGRSSGDLMKDGSQGLLSAMKDIGTAMAKKAVSSSITALISLAGPVLIIPIIVILVCFILMTGLTGGIIGSDSDGVNDNYDFWAPPGDGYTFQMLSIDDIDSIISRLYKDYPDDMTYDIEIVLRYALSKVGCEYNQNYHGSLTKDIFDCSSLVYRSYREIGIKIRNGDSYCAAEEARCMENKGKVVGGDLLPGDIVFYGGSDNGRYKGIYHVAIYVGNGKAVEAKNKQWGVVFGDLRTNNVVMCARPTKK